MREYLEAICFAGEDSLSFVEYAKRVGITQSDTETVGHVIAVFRDGLAGTLMRTVVYEVTNGLVSLVETAKTTILYLPIPSDTELVHTIGAWVRSEYDEDMLMEFREDGAIGMGAGIAVGGTYQEYGVRYFLDQHKDELFHILESMGEK
jgi:hypothetical protein